MFRQTSIQKMFLLFAVASVWFTSCQPTGTEVSTASQESIDKVCVLAAEVMQIDRVKVSAETTLHDLGCDDLDYVEIVIEIEDAFGVEFPDETLNNLVGIDRSRSGMKNVSMQKLAAVAESLLIEQRSLKPE